MFLLRLLLLLSLAAPFAGAQDLAAVERAAASVVAVVVRDANGGRVAGASGVFVEVGRLVVPRTLLLSRAHTASVDYGGREQRITAVLADSAASGVALVAVDLPDGAPSPARPASAAALRPGRYHVLVPGAPPIAADVDAERDVPGIGPACRLEAASPSPTMNGGAVVNGQGELVGVALERAAADARVWLVIPAPRLATLAPVAPLPLAAWRQQQGPGRPVEAEAAFLRGLDASLAGRAEEAAAGFREAARGSASDAEAKAALAASELEAGRNDAALDAFRAAVNADPENPRYHHELAVVLFDRERWSEAAAEFGQVTRLRPEDPQAHFNLGTAFGKLGRYREEYDAYQAAIGRNSAHVGALRNLGIVCIVLKRYAEAVAVTAKAVRFLPFDAKLHAQLGVAYYDMADYRSAIEELKKAVAIEPGFVRGRFGLAVAYAAAGRHREALAECETLKALDPQRGAEVLKLVSGK